ncbi:MAG TPA: hexose kinase [Terriglobales bacterium]|nr:hexose kinase [Terriglobales bacterium]
MICTVSLNPAVDKYLRVASLRRGEHLEAEEVLASAGGKAINVAGVLRVLEEEVELLGFFGGFTGDYILGEVAREGIRADPVEVSGLTRTAFVLVEADGSETEVVEPGAPVGADDIAALRAKLRAAAARAAVVVLSGSVPAGCPDDIYVQLLGDCGGRCPVIVDTSRVHLRTLLAARPEPGPTMIKPNRREAEAAVGHALARADDLARVLEQFAACGVAMPVVSDGAAGLWARLDGQVWHARPPALVRVNSVGSGDAAVAGLAAGLARQSPPEEMLRLAAACGAANVLTKECGAVRREDVERLLGQIEVVRAESRGE